MKVGLIARGEDRGLGTLSREWYRHMEPDKTLLVIPDGVAEAGLTTHADWFPDVTHVAYGFPEAEPVGRLDEQTCCEWLDGLDVVYAGETFYDWRFCTWARHREVATVCHAMPEFLSQEFVDCPTQWWAPTSYRLDLLPTDTRVVPVPIPTDRWRGRHSRRPGDPLRWLHLAGAETIEDRNGTGAVMAALRQVRRRIRMTIRSQTPVEEAPPSLPSHVSLTMRRGTVRDYWRLYDADVLVMPRRYAGLCLPVLEAMGAGLAVVMTDLSPQREDWPVTLIPTVGEPETKEFLGGEIEIADADTHALAELMDAWNADPSLWEQAVACTQAWVATQSWDALRPVVEAELRRAVELHSGAAPPLSDPPPLPL